jgi:hypothetical protein
MIPFIYMNKYTSLFVVSIEIKTEKGILFLSTMPHKKSFFYTIDFVKFATLKKIDTYENIGLY